MILITGATGKLGSFIVEGLLEKGVPTSDIALLVRNPDKAARFAESGVAVRKGNYDDPESLQRAFSGVDTLMFISSSELGARTPAHKNVVNAAKNAGVGLVVYTSILGADSSPLDLAKDHRETEAYLEASGLQTVILRNGWYFENYTENLAAALEHGVIMGAAGSGAYSMATRKDYAEAAVAVLTHSEPQAGNIYELGGSPSVTLRELASEVARQSGKQVVYADLSAQDFEAKLASFGLPPFIAHLLADADAGASAGHLQTDSQDLVRLIGRPTTSLREAVASGLGLLAQ